MTRTNKTRRTTHHFTGSRDYETVIWSDGSISCNCPGWIFKRAGRDRTCKHTRQVRTAEALDFAGAQRQEAGAL